MNKYIRAILESEKPVFFISPHLDDAVFSCGALMKTLAGRAPIHVITVFTEAHNDHNTLSASAFLKQCAYTDAHNLFQDRRAEDLEVLTSLGAHAIHLDYIDALWRRKKLNSKLFAPVTRTIPELIHYYPTYRMHILSGKIAKGDRDTLQLLTSQLQDIVPTDAIVFAPAAIGNHVDHVMVRRACEAAFPNFIYWTDFPYMSRTGRTIETTVPHGIPFECRSNLDVKLGIMNGYRTQVFAIKEFRSNHLELGPERYSIRS